MSHSANAEAKISKLFIMYDKQLSSFVCTLLSLTSCIAQVNPCSAEIKLSMFIEKDFHCLFLYHTIPHFDEVKISCCGKHGDLLVTSNFSFSHNVFYPIGTYFPFLKPFKMSSAISFNLDQSKILSSGNELKPLDGVSDRIAESVEQD